MKPKNALLLCVLALRPGLAHAGATAGAEPFDFLFLDANARSVGMGGAYTALATDANALLYNPAGLGRIQHHEVTLMHNQYVEGLTQEYVGFAAKQGWGLSLNYLSFGNVARTTLSEPNGTLGQFHIGDLALGAGYGQEFFEALSLGAGVKYIRETNDDVRADAYALDAGALLVPPDVQDLRLALVVQNLGPDAKFLNEKEKLPLNLRAGAAYARGDTTVSADLTKERSDRVRLAAGVETVLAKAVALRLGFSTRNEAGVGITGGAGWLWRNVSIDYAIVPFGDLGIAHRVSLSFRWGQTAGEPAARPGPGAPRLKPLPNPPWF